MHAKGMRPAVNAPRLTGIVRAQRILGGVLWLGFAALLLYIST